MDEPTLLVIDTQEAFNDPAWGNRNNPDAERNIKRLLDAWRRRKAPIIHVRHRSARPEGRFRGAGEAFKPEAQPLPDETIIQKSVNSAFIGTNLDERLRDAGAETIVIAGLTTDHCCSTTARMGANLGFTVWFVADGTATFDRGAPDGGLIDAATMHRTALASLADEFAEIVDTAEVISRLSAMDGEDR
jgi:nicotinamidase-related amidase